jgi:hypothetical protein
VSIFSAFVPEDVPPVAVTIRILTVGLPEHDCGRTENVTPEYCVVTTVPTARSSKSIAGHSARVALFVAIAAMTSADTCTMRFIVVPPV